MQHTILLTVAEPVEVGSGNSSGYSGVSEPVEDSTVFNVNVSKL